MDTLSCTAEPTLSILTLKDNRHEITKSAAQSSLMITINEEDRFLGQNNHKFSQQPRYGNQNNQTPYQQNGFNPDRNRKPNPDRQYHQNKSSNSWNNGPVTVSRLSITSMPDQRILTLNTIKTIHRATTYLHRTQFHLSTIRDKM